ncbi:MAG: ABC transporter ATP-binding protein [Bacilli bacterium]|nr:ABC transporter ATP-binding protein [Bacilli bacterium]
MANNRRHGPTTERAKDFKGTLKKLLSYLSAYKKSFAIVIIFSSLSTIFSIIGPRVLGDAITELSNGVFSKLSGGTGIDFTKIGRLLIFLLCLYIVSAVFNYIQGFIVSGISQKITYKLRNQISKKVNKLPISYFDKKTNGEVLSLVTNDVDTLSQNIDQSATQLITNFITVIGILIMMLSIDFIMTIIALLIVPVSLVLIGTVAKFSQKHFINQQDYLADINGTIEEMYSGQNIIKAFNAQEKMLKKFNIQNEKLYNSAWKSSFLSGLMHPIMVFIGNLGYVLISIIGGYFTIKGRIKIGNIQSFISYTKNFTQPITQVAQISNMLQAMMAAAERIFEFLDEPEEEITKKNKVDILNIKGNVSFNHVKFGYNPENIIINDFSAKIKQGQKIAIVGPTGAGKSTIVKLLMRFYNINDGEILVDGININDFNRSEFRHIFGMVLQDAWVFSGTIMDNLRYGKLNATDNEVIEAAKKAHAHHFIKTLPDGYNMYLNEETSNISGGQKQLLTIARAILADPKVLILDEATSSVDTRTEVLIQKAMDELMKNRTTFIIAHRLSTIKNADMILVMKNGDIIETGNHDSLMKQNGFYASLYNSQFEE